jgi:hypothetical protein
MYALANFIQSVIVISLSTSQWDHITRLPLYCTLKGESLSELVSGRVPERGVFLVELKLLSPPQEVGPELRRRPEAKSELQISGSLFRSLARGG